VRTREEEIVNAYTHLLSSVIGLVFGTIVVTGGSLDVFSKGTLLIMVLTSSWTFFASFLYHKTFLPTQRERNRLVDRVGIYMMIMGSGVATSLTCSNLIVATGASCILVLVSCFLIANMCIKRSLPEWFCVTSYILLGWVGIFPALGILGPSGFTEAGVLWLLLLSGGFYSMGVLFYSNDSHKWFHTIWHIFTMLGYACHFTAELIALKAISIH